ncbi:hypothetical protein [Aquibacillus salsiterrae]|uniref:Uncharacterized protein n=1 Tax=Aquibacillus salsiterrae TaxID=2950439 RepID=A0A9X3WC15_9BACI|nr:hypothetical protein [Aquibacillus salsiterrae]MDC3416960.1 hypothetical protein [Aquibacillus salsiterrae]
MSKTVRAYFATENDVESVNADLRTLKVKHVTKDAIPEGYEQHFVVPIAGVNTTGNATGASNGMFAAINGQVDLDEPTGENNRTQVLEFEVDEQDLMQALSILKEHDGHIEKDLLD